MHRDEQQQRENGNLQHLTQQSRTSLLTLLILIGIVSPPTGHSLAGHPLLLHYILIVLIESSAAYTDKHTALQRATLTTLENSTALHALRSPPHVTCRSADTTSTILPTPPQKRTTSPGADNARSAYRACGPDRNVPSKHGLDTLLANRPPAPARGSSSRPPAPSEYTSDGQGHAPASGASR